MAIPKSFILEYQKFSHSAKLKAFYVFSLLFLALDPPNIITSCYFISFPWFSIDISALLFYDHPLVAKAVNSKLLSDWITEG